MAAKRKAHVSPEIVAKARQVLEFAEGRAKEVADRTELFNAVFGVNGKATQLFPTEAERAAFLRTAERKRIAVLMDTLPWPAANGRVEFPATVSGRSA
jgi:hypothetical protein